MRITTTLADIMKKIGPLTKKYANLPERYIKRASEIVEYTTPNKIQYLPRERKRLIYKFGMDRPWTDEFRRANEGELPEELILEPIKEWSIFRGDRVEVLVGRDKGKQGIVTQLIQERNWVIVAGLNWEFKWVGQTTDNPGTVVRSERPLLVTTQVSLVDPSDHKPVKIEWRFTEDGDRVRVSLRTGRIVPMPKMTEETIDYKTRATYLEGDKDTKADIVETISFQPELKTFEMDIMDTLGVKESRLPKGTYWY